MVALRKVEEIGLSLEASGGDAALAGLGQPIASWDRLDLVDVTHAYRGEREDHGFLLGPIDLSLRPGELVFGWLGGLLSGCLPAGRRLAALFGWLAVLVLGCPVALGCPGMLSG